MILAVLGIAACSADQTLLTAAAAPTTCLPGERGYLRVGLRGAMDRDLDWRGAQLQCEGGARPAGNGLRMSFSGSTADPDQKLRIVFGISIRPGVHTASNLPTNITVIIEGENRLYATQGEEKCVVESLVQEALSVAPDIHAYRVAARGYCVDPATTLDGAGRLYINRFDFAGIARFEDYDLHVPEPHPAAGT